MPSYQKQGLIQRYNYKRYSKIRWNFFMNFALILIFFAEFKFNHFSLNNIFSILVAIGIVVQFAVSVPCQVFYYYVKLPTKHYKVNLKKKDIKIYKIHMIVSIVNLLLMIVYLHSINVAALVAYVSCVLVILYFDYYMISWYQKILLTDKDKYFNIIKTIYLSLSKNERNF